MKENIKEYINRLRFDFTKASLSENELEKSPLLQFEKWFIQAVEAKVEMPNAMVLCTVSKTLQPSARVMLLRNFDENGFVFYTNYYSRKGEDLQANPLASLTFFWPQLERQVRIEGTVEKQNESESDIYFEARPDSSKLGAWSSQQSHVIKDRTVLEHKYEEMKTFFSTGEIPRPAFWGGYVVKPSYYEFWQGRASRLHDRFAYASDEQKNWRIYRLAP